MLILLTNVFLYFVVRHRDEILRITSLEHSRGRRGLSKFAYSLVNPMIVNGTMVPILALCELERFCCQDWSHGFTPSLGCLGRIMPKTVNLALISPDGAAIFGIGRWNFPTSSNPHLITKVVLESRHDSAMDVPPCLWRLFRKVRKWHEAHVRSRWIRFQKSDELSLHSAFGDSRQQKRRIRCLISLGTKIWRGCLNL